MPAKQERPRRKPKNQKAPSLTFGLGPLRDKSRFTAQLVPSEVPLLIMVMGDGLRIVFNYLSIELLFFNRAKKRILACAGQVYGLVAFHRGDLVWVNAGDADAFVMDL